jgi:uncharacterized protein (UPF0212 family)
MEFIDLLVIEDLKKHLEVLTNQKNLEHKKLENVKIELYTKDCPIITQYIAI